MNKINSNSLTLMKSVSRRWKVMLALAILMSTLISVDAAAFKRDINGQVKKASPELTTVASTVLAAATNIISTAKPDLIVHHADLHHNGTWETSAYNKNVTLDNDDDNDDGGEEDDENADEISNSRAATPTAAATELDADKNDGDNNGNEEDDDDDDNDDEQIYGENENYLDNYDDNENGEDEENPEFEEEDDGGAI